MRVFIYGQSLQAEVIPHVQDLLNYLLVRKVETFFYQPFYENLPAEVDRIASKGLVQSKDHLGLKTLNPDFVITLGGDGTILSAVTLIRDLGIPILGINLGRMGFLASTEKSNIREAIDLLLEEKYRMDNRSMLEVDCNYPVFGDTKFGLNDFTLHKRDTSSMITIHTFVNGEFLNSFWADGVIVSTPTGSTGYSLSCGGPIIFPNSGNFVITPVAPHNLTVRPIVISENSIISFQLEGRTKNFLCTLDSRFETISAKHEIAIRKCNFEIKLVQLEGTTFSKTIHNKLNWGKDTRN